MISINIEGVFQIRSVKLMVPYVNFNPFFQDFHCLLFIKLSLDHQRTMRDFTKDLNLYSVYNQYSTCLAVLFRYH